MDQMEDNLQNMRKNVLLIRERKEKLEVRATIDGDLDCWMQSWDRISLPDKWSGR